MIILGIFCHGSRIMIYVKELGFYVFNFDNVGAYCLLFEFSHYSLVHPLTASLTIKTLLNQLILPSLTLLQFWLIDSLHGSHLVPLFQLVCDSLFLLLDVRTSLKIKRLLWWPIRVKWRQQWVLSFVVSIDALWKITPFFQVSIFWSLSWLDIWARSTPAFPSPHNWFELFRLFHLFSLFLEVLVFEVADGSFA